MCIRDSHTTATDKNGKKEIEAVKDVTIVDKVTLDGLEVGTKYKLSGWQMLKEKNAELLIEMCIRDSANIINSLIPTSHKIPIEQNRCAMACQGCGAVLFLLKKQGNYFP